MRISEYCLKKRLELQNLWNIARYVHVLACSHEFACIETVIGSIHNAKVFWFSMVLLLLQVPETLKNSKSSCSKISHIGKSIWITGVSALLSC